MNAYPAEQGGGTVMEQLKNACSLLMFDFAIFLKRKSIGIYMASTRAVL